MDPRNFHPMAGLRPSIPFGLDILPAFEVEPFGAPSSLYPPNADPLSNIPWGPNGEFCWPLLSPFKTAVGALDVMTTILLALPFPVRLAYPFERCGLFLTRPFRVAYAISAYNMEAVPSSFPGANLARLASSRCNPVALWIGSYS